MLLPLYAVRRSAHSPAVGVGVGRRLFCSVIVGYLGTDVPKPIVGVGVLTQTGGTGKLDRLRKQLVLAVILVVYIVVLNGVVVIDDVSARIVVVLEIHRVTAQGVLHLRHLHGGVALSRSLVPILDIVPVPHLTLLEAAQVVVGIADLFVPHRDAFQVPIACAIGIELLPGGDAGNGIAYGRSRY